MPIYKGNKRIQIPRSRYLENTAKRNGWRHKIFTFDGDWYKGQWENDKKCGKGVLLSTKKLVYEGDFAKNHRNGFGVLAREIGDLKVYELVYRGEWKNGKMHGLGLKIFKDKSYYLGEWKYGIREGLGKMWYKNGSYYDGQWLMDHRHGIGMLVKSDGNRYEGNWKNGLKHGQGIYLHLDSGQLQHGVWKDDICTFSKLSDIQFRQTAHQPTKYPILPIGLKFTEELCQIQEERTLHNISDHCMGIYSTEGDSGHYIEQSFLRDWSSESSI